MFLIILTVLAPVLYAYFIGNPALVILLAIVAVVILSGIEFGFFFYEASHGHPMWL